MQLMQRVSTLQFNTVLNGRKQIGCLFVGLLT